MIVMMMMVTVWICTLSFSAVILKTATHNIPRVITIIKPLCMRKRMFVSLPVAALHASTFVRYATDKTTCRYIQHSEGQFVKYTCTRT